MQGKKIAIYGYGEIGHIIESYTKMDVVCIIDNYCKVKADKAEIVTYAQFLTEYKDKCDAVIISLYSRKLTDDLIENLEQDGIEYGIIKSPQLILKNKVYNDCNILWSDTDAGSIRILLTMENKLSVLENCVYELQWGQVFNNTITDSTWFYKKSVSPAGWAAGYNLLYKLYRALDDVPHTCILELGMGQTTKLIGQYVFAHDECCHYVVEHDEDWVEYFLSSIEYMEKSNVVNLPLITKEYNGSKYLAYDGFKEKFWNKKFDLIVIDGPFGGAGGASRRDILDLLPETLADNFVMLLDDCGRQGEINTVKDIEKILKRSGIRYGIETYPGPMFKNLVLIVSESNKWLLTV